jgi:hypothetical protein
VVGLGRVPIAVHGLGVYYRRFFDPEVDYVARIRGEHTFQSLTESTKPGTAHRTGIYLTTGAQGAGRAQLPPAALLHQPVGPDRQLPLHRPTHRRRAERRRPR